MNRTILETKPMSTIDYREAKKSNDPKTFINKYASRVAENAELVVQYPFLLPLDYQGNVPKDYDFTYTEVDMVPKGWHSIVRAMSEEIRFYLVNKGIDPYAFHIDQLKEKFGSIRLYYSLYCKDCADRLKAEEGKHWDFSPLERSTWTKIKDSQIFSYGEMKNEAQADSHQ